MRSRDRCGGGYDSVVSGEQLPRLSYEGWSHELVTRMTSTGSLDGGEALCSGLDAQFRGPLMRFFLRRVKSKSEAEDLTQEVFARLVGSSNLSQLERAESFVFTIALNLLRDRSRRADVRMRAVPSGHGIQEVDAPSHGMVEYRTPDRVLLGCESLADVLNTLNELGQRTRDIFILFRLENMKQQEIAALYGIARSTVEKHVMKAVLHLATRYGSESIDG
jgi:RNA polymerase sigma factor (sigma-70 family)